MNLIRLKLNLIFNLKKDSTMRAQVSLKLPTSLDLGTVLPGHYG